MLNRTKTITVRCDECNHVWPIKTWIAIDEQEDAEAVQMIEDGILFTQYCPKCSKEYEYVSPTIYYDTQKKAMICFVEGLIHSSEAEHFINELVNECGGSVSDISVRLTTSCNEFREKVILHRSGIDDRIAELVKVQAFDVVRSEGWKQHFEEARCSVDANQDIQIELCGSEPRYIVLNRAIYDDFVSKVTPVLEKEKTPLCVNLDWAVEFCANNNI